MDDDHLLKLNPHQVIKCLDGIITASELDKIKQEIGNNVKQLIRLAESHLRFANAASGILSWRQRVSRGYYACYSASKAIRLGVQGIYNTDVKDHQKIGSLPDTFPNHAHWKDLLTKFRGDRNIADYDHSESESALEMNSTAYLAKATEFLNETKTFLRHRGLL